MIMKKFSFYLLFTFLYISCSQSSEVKISGNFGNASDKKVFLFLITDKQPLIKDSTIIKDDGSFSFSFPATEPAFYRVSSKDIYIDVIAKNGDQIKIKADHTKDKKKYEVSGSADSEFIKKAKDFSAGYEKVAEGLNKNYIDNMAAKTVNMDSVVRLLNAKNETAVTQLNQELKSMISNSKQSYGALYVINFLNPEQEAVFINNFIAENDKTFGKTDLYIGLKYRMQEMKKLAIGQPAPEISMPTPAGKILSLSSLKGKYVLVDFWASWCGPCRKENPNVVKLYNEYNSKGFEILGVSLDTKKENWEKAISDDKLTWPHISELAGWQTSVVKNFKIESIPSTLLVDKDGNILARNLRGEDLENYLKKLFN